MESVDNVIQVKFMNIAGRVYVYQIRPSLDYNLVDLLGQVGMVSQVNHI